MDGICWIPDRKWATEVVEECAEFPNGEFDDYVDAVTLALMRYRQGGFVVLSTDRKEVEIVRAPRRKAYY
jgi:phage terminase large subunit-like protein